MPTFDVHLYPIVRAKVVGIEAPTMAEAIKLAEERAWNEFQWVFRSDPMLPLKDGGTLQYTEFDDGDITKQALVDVQGDEGYAQSAWFSRDAEKNWKKD